MKNLKKMMKKEEGFTLIELIIVIAILAIIAAVAIPNIMGAVENSRKATDVANAKTIMNAGQTVFASTNTTPAANVDITEANLNSGTPSAFEVALYQELNATAPLPKFQGKHFVLVYDSGTNAFSVQTDAGVVVAPTPSSSYDQN